MLNEFSKSRDLLKFWNISIPSEDKYEYKNITVKSINGYVPFYTEEDNNDDRLLFGKKSDKTKEGLIDSINNKSPKTFLHIAKKALNQVDNTFEGIEALGVLKADIDNFGVLFACGLPETKQTFSRLSTLSRNFNNFFTVFLPYILKNTKEYKNIYTVFAGGDDLFLIGSWNIIIDFAEFIIKTIHPP
jgi:CRISPR-associated protein Csm1